ncbi:uncharacterized protein BXZ73DRAFT_39030 [Epithele typhae]|uniref:uncharacterized protein n=1 Tax=Epithele typhae TaxID=378194 RepID=UPI002007513B|nr:uncharacterized protein BXZ73DRAFT_39030 [Epithele typhae]KAH9945219.1 hypothetical protein BXZ73DRAFT_39030 [Epithele typhae]
MSQQPELLPRPDGGTLAASSPSPPIVELARFLAHLLTISYRFLSQTTLALALSIFAPLTVLYSPVSYVLAPIFVFLRVLLSLLVLTPYAIATSLAQNAYPIYVFVGAALLCALCVGILARAISSGIQRALFAPSHPRSRARVAGNPSPPPAVPKSEKSSLRTSASKPRVKKRVSIREERGG